ncbi:hypothetical protein Tco_0215522 [Tanacetum coccineum]
MTESKTNTTMEEFVTKDRVNYYSGITNITVNGKAAYEVKGKFLDGLRDNAFSRTNGEDAVEHIEYFLKIVDPIDLPNVDNKEGVTNKEFSDLEEANKNDEHKIAEIFRIENNLFDYETPLCTEFKEFHHLLKVVTELFTHDIKRTMTYEDYESELNNEVGEPWSKDGVPYELCDHICKPFHFENGKTKCPTCNSNEDGFSNGGDLKEEALKQKAIYEKSWGDATQSVINFCAWLKRSFGNFHELDYELLVKLEECWWKINDHECSPFANWIDRIRRPYANINTTHDPYLDGRNGRACNNNDNQENKEQHKEGRCHLFNDPAREPPVCKIRRFEMIKYSFGQEDEYVAIKEYEYDDLTRPNEDACHAYQEIFRNMDEGWFVTRAE